MTLTINLEKAGLRIFVITVKISRISTEDIELKDSLDSQLQIESISSIGIFSLLEVMTKLLNPGKGV